MGTEGKLEKLVSKVPSDTSFYIWCELGPEKNGERSAHLAFCPASSRVPHKTGSHLEVTYIRGGSQLIGDYKA